LSQSSLEGKVALVTGSAKRIGRSVALRLASEGADVIVNYRSSKSEAEEVVSQITALGRRAKAVQADVAKRDDVTAMFALVEKEFGRLDILVNNAGMSIRKPPESYTIEEWHRVLDTNLTGALVCCQAAYPHMQRQGGGKIINIGSMMAIFGAAYAAAYSASKGAIVQLTKSLATAWAKDNLQVNAVLPGWIDTELTRDARHQVPGLNERILNRTPAGRWGVPDDLAGVAVFLSGPASDFVTGATIPVDGGFSAEF
jgi:2-dehydro-3-deoxy-D-gluconate 5-dehydrogenase